MNTPHYPYYRAKALGTHLTTTSLPPSYAARLVYASVRAEIVVDHVRSTITAISTHCFSPVVRVVRVVVRW